MAKFNPAAAQIIHFTGMSGRFTRSRCRAPPFRLLGHLLGTADIIAQMSDRC
jgi:hypothetical protein